MSQIVLKMGQIAPTRNGAGPPVGQIAIWPTFGRQKFHVGAIWPTFGANLEPKIEPDRFKSEPDTSNKEWCRPTSFAVWEQL